MAATLTSPGPMDAEVKGRVPQAYAEAVDKDVTRRQRKFPRASRADVLRDALTEYFAKRGIKLNGKEHAHAD